MTTKSKSVPYSPYVRCAYRSPKTGQCINTFPVRGPKKYCTQSHQVRAYQERSGKGRKRDALREAAIQRDGGCVRGLRPHQRKSDDELLKVDWDERNRYELAICRGKLLVRIIDPAKRRTLENVQTLCGRHFGRISDERLRERLGPERYRQTKKFQARHYYRMRAMMRKSVRIYKGPPKNPLDYIDYT